MNLLIQSITSFRIICGPICFFLIVYMDYFGYALIMFSLGAISDFFDGYFARKFHMTSVFGEVFDPIADKILITFLLLAISLNLNSELLGFLTCCILAREFWVGALRDLNARNNIIDATSVTFLAKIKTTSQLATISLYLFGLYLNNALIIFISDFFLFGTFLITIYTGIQYTKATFQK